MPFLIPDNFLKKPSGHIFLPVLAAYRFRPYPPVQPNHILRHANMARFRVRQPWFKLRASYCSKAS